MTFRLALAQSSPPCIPYIGLILQDLTFVQIGNPDKLDGKINFAKRWQQFNILVRISSIMLMHCLMSVPCVTTVLQLKLLKVKLLIIHHIFIGQFKTVQEGTIPHQQTRRNSAILWRLSTVPFRRRNVES